MLRHSLLRVLAVLALASSLAACASLRHGYTLAQYEGQVLKVNGGNGVERLRIESAFDATIANWFAQSGDPDYIHVKSQNVVELCYIGEDRLITFTRGWLPESAATVSEPIPERLSNLFVQADRQRLSAQRSDVPLAPLPLLLSPEPL